MSWNDETERDAARFFESSYVLWAVGMLDPELTAELDALTPPGWEPWRQTLERECPLNRQDLQSLFLKLCDSMSDEEAVELLLEIVDVHRRSVTRAA